VALTARPRDALNRLAPKATAVTAEMTA
jgi:hypothetical protein